MWYKIIGLAVAGACGTLARYGLAGFIQSGNHSGFPWGTLTVNVLGCFVFGLVWTLMQQQLLFSGETRMIILVGFLGSFTTFSAFLFETEQMIEDAQWLQAGANVIGELAIGFCAYLLGAFLGRLA